MKMEWDKNFSDNYTRIYSERFSDALTDKQAAFIANFIKPYGRIVDIPCGFGRHVEAFAKLGFTVHGVDLYNISEAERRRGKLTKDIQARITYEKSDMRTWRGKDYDAAVSLFSSFGYFTDAENKEVIKNAIASVKKGGVIILDNLNLNILSHTFSINEKHENIAKDKKYGEQTIFDPKTNIVTIQFVIGTQKISASLRVYSLSELEQMFRENGCVIESSFGSYNGEKYSLDESKRLIVVARKTV